MAGDKKVAQAEPVAVGFKSDTKLAEHEVVPRKDGKPLNATVLYQGDAPTVKGDNVQKSGAEQGGYQPPNSCYDYHYSGYGGTYNQVDGGGHNYMNATGGSYTGVQSENGSQLYYLSGYPYSNGQQSYYPSSGYSSESMPCYSCDSTYAGDVNHGTNSSWSKRSTSTFNGKSSGFGSKRPTSTFNGKTSNFPLDMKSRQPTVSSMLQNQQLKSLNKYASGYQPAGLVKGFQPVGNFSPYTNQNQGLYGHNIPLNYNLNARLLNDDRFKLREKSYRSGDSETSAELTRGPRGHNNIKPTSLPTENEKQGLSSRSDQYNLNDFKTEYENAKFYVIKSYSEDDVHKCVKYDVWSSTPNGNKKLDAAFQEADGRTSGETRAICPVFLFFSVNASGQFVGVAEMIGRVDFDKNMDFWQVDKWSGFFPVKWHIIKDVPNTQLRHIILENNDNRPVTYTRDTQEVGLKQGLEMLSIFKNYSAKTSLLDDFLFYEDREKQLKAKRTSKAALQTEMYSTNDLTKNFNAGESMIGRVPVAVDSSAADPTSNIIDLTRSLSLNSHTLKTKDNKLLPSVPSSE